MTILILLCMTLLLPGTAFAQGEEEYVHEQNFSSDHQLTGLFASFQEGFQVGQWELHGAVLTLCFSATPLLQEDVSDFTISLNGQRFYSNRIPLTQGQVIQTEIELPVDALVEGYNIISVETYLRTNDEDPCRDDVATASWMTVLSDSSVAITYTPTAACNDISDFYTQFSSIDALENMQSTLCIPTSAGDTDFTAASLALTGLSGNALLFYDNIDMLQADSVPQKLKYVLYISQYSLLPTDLSNWLTDEQRQAIQDGFCVMLLKDINGCNVLLVTGEGDAVIKAGQALANADYMQQIKSDWLRINVDEDILMRKDDRQTISQLTKVGSYVKGPFRQTTSFGIDNPANRKLAEGSELKLSIRYSENLDFNRSMVTAYINDTPIGSKKLTKEGAQGDNVTFALPENLEITGAFTLKLAFDLEVPDLYCTQRQDEMPWAFVTSDSMITLYTEDTPYLLFENYPAPFVHDGSLNDVTVILPDIMSESDLEVLRGVMTALGRFITDNTGSLKIVHNSNIGDVSKSNIIVIGRFEKNAIAQQLNNQLFFQFSPNGTTIRSNEKMVIEPNYGATLGCAQLLYSPYSTEKHGMLIISGVTDEGMERAALYLSKVEKLWGIYGDGFVADSDNSYSFRFKDDNAKKATFFEMLSERYDMLLLISVCTFIILILIITMITIKVRGNRRKRRRHYE